jgi:hypothetical protein
MHRPVTRLATRLLLLTLLAACASGGSRARPPAERSVRTDSVVVRVTNGDPRPLAIAVAQAGVQTPLGEVAGRGVARFALPAADVARARIALVATANRETMRTVLFDARGGQVVWFDIVPGLVGSQAVVRWPEEGPPRGARGGPDGDG